MVEVAGGNEDAAGARWKSRYLGALDAQERLEEDAGRRIGELSALVARLGRAMPDAPARPLSRRLEKLGDALKRRPLDPGLSRDVQDVHQSVLGIMEAGERERKALAAALETAANRLEAAAHTAALRRKLRRFRNTVERRAGRSAASDLMGALAELQDAVLDAPAAPAPVEREPAAVDRRPEPAPAPGSRPAGDADAATAGTIDREVVRAALDDLVAGVDLPGDLQRLLVAAVAELERDFHEPALLAVLARVRDLFDDAFSGIHQEFHGFLDSVDRRLDAVLTALAEASESDRAAGGAGRELAAGLESGLAAMRDAARDAPDLDALKSSIDGQLESLARSVGDFREHAGALDKGRERRLEELRNRLRELEGQSRVARGQLEAQRRLARIDELTGLANRRALQERLHDEVAAWQRQGKPLAVAMADLDHFKQVNDRFGHAAGDRALSIFADIVTRRIRQADFCARYGGEEFVLILPGTDAATAVAVVEEVRGFVESCGFSCRGTPVPVTASFGVVEATSGDDAASLLSRADQALYAAKQAGRNRVERR